MIINTNMNALNAHRNMGINNTQAGKSMEKLSSGLRINRAGDDAAGLAISEKMRGQIRGLDQASRNSQDGISMIQTAEGALNETHNILQRMRELSVQSSNDTNTEADRTEIQKEIQQLTEEIDRIGNNTEFNTQKLLNGEKNDGITTTTKGSAGKAAEAGIVGVYEIDLAAITNNVEIDGQTFNYNAVTPGAGEFNDAASLKTAIEANASIKGNYVVTVSGSKITLTQAGGKETSAGANVVGATSNQVTAGKEAVAAVPAKPGVIKFEAGKDGLEIDGRKFTKEQIEDTAKFQDAIDASSLAGKYTVIRNGNEITLTQTTASASEKSPEIKGQKTEGIQLQIGANEGQTISVAMNDMRAEALGINMLNVTNKVNASDAITVVDEAIKNVSAERSKLGAVQNRLEYTTKNLDNTSENLTAAESRIRDVDMAKEMLNFSKNNILNQAAQSMLAQAKSQPEGVLQLLR